LKGRGLAASAAPVVSTKKNLERERSPLTKVSTNGTSTDWQEHN